MIKAALFDLDGLLVNSEELYLQANQKYFKSFDFEFTEDHHRDGTGKKFEDWITTLVSINKSGGEILTERNRIFFELVREKLKLLEGAGELLRVMSGSLQTALVTSSKKDYVDLVFERTGIHTYFDVVITGDMVENGKPHPEGYLLAAQRLGVLSRECVVLEDAPSGVLAGRNAGMKVIAVPSRYIKGDRVYEKADLVVDNLSQITHDTILAWD